MTMATTAQRAAAARRARTAGHRPVGSASDRCPLCASELGGAGRTTRRLAVARPTPGRFAWQCPDCRGSWETGTGNRP